MQKSSRFFPLLILLLLFMPLLSQAQQGFNYQAAARDGGGSLLRDAALTVGFLVHKGTAAGPVVYEETHNATTNSFGIFNLVIGEGNAVSGTFAGIQWAGDAHFLEVRINGNILGTEELVAVPYAKVATSMDLADLGDVSDAAPANGEVLQWNGSLWEPGAASSSDWLTSGTSLYYDAGRVFVGRNNAITGNEYFGVKTPTGNNTYGGMYLETDGLMGYPFYGYATDGSARAWTYWRGTDSTFRIYNGGERFAITQQGQHGFETTDPQADMHLVHDVITNSATQAGFRGLKLENSGPNDNDWTFYVQNLIADLYLYYENTAVGRFNDVDGSYSTLSDARYKSEVELLPAVLDRVLSLPVRRYRYQHQQPGDDQRSIGFFAQEVETRFPELVTSTEQDGGEGAQMVNYAGFSPIAIKAIQEQQALIEAQTARIEALEARLKAIEARLE